MTSSISFCTLLGHEWCLSRLGMASMRQAVDPLVFPKKEAHGGVFGILS
jgi:hypothetical protein